MNKILVYNIDFFLNLLIKVECYNENFYAIYFIGINIFIFGGKILLKFSLRLY